MDKAGRPVLDEDGNQKSGFLEKACPKLKQRDHGSWYYSIELPPARTASADRAPRRAASARRRTQPPQPRQSGSSHRAAWTS
ncbi:hypothetical protein ACFQ0G_28240 [Streptomyces chiangmaiensis]